MDIKPYNPEVREDLLQHLKRHRAESGTNGIHFMPFAPNDPDGPKGIDADKACWPIDTPGWQRWFCARDTHAGQVVGHVDLKSDGLRTGQHRCELGIGIETAWRGMGLGRRLMLTAIEFVRGETGLEWIDLRVFAHNAAARALYESLGFEEVGVLKDRFRIDGKSIDDVLMCLKVKNQD